MFKPVLPFSLDENSFDNIYNKDYILLDKPVIGVLDYPVKLDVTVGIICIKGKIKGSSNMREFEANASCLAVLLSEHTVMIDEISDDFSGKFIIMSRKFAESLNVEERIPVFISLNENPCVPLDQEELVSLEDYFKMCQKTLKQIHNPFVIRIIQHLTKAHFYAFAHNLHHIEKHHKNGKKPRQEEVVQKFLDDLQTYFKTERSIEFYADRLCITPKYLSKVIKDNNGMSAKKWIDDYVIWETKALLKSTNMTVQQISDELNFPSQSFFGKYFKRLVGLSPLEYRKT